jgi:hypothetical protein
MTAYQRRMALKKLKRRVWFRDNLNPFKIVKRFLCKVFGHKRPYIEKMWCFVCPRCRIIVEWKEKNLLKAKVTFENK